MPTVVAYYPVHYGAEYFDASIRSIDPCVERILILYTSHPSYGHQTNCPCPESEQLLRDIALRASPHKVEWHNVTDKKFCNEGEHRGYAVQIVGKNVDQLLAVDTDEVWDTDILRKSLNDAYILPARYIQVRGWTNFWRSFNYACVDSWTPTRIINLKHMNNDSAVVDGCIYHFGYAQSSRIVDYKWKIHGHQNELRPGWFQNIFMNWKESDVDVHPVARGVWNPQPFSKELLPELLRNHPYYSLKIIP